MNENVKELDNRIQENAAKTVDAPAAVKPQTETSTEKKEVSTSEKKETN
jgi:hypothetical protein